MLLFTRYLGICFSRDSSRNRLRLAGKDFEKEVDAFPFQCLEQILQFAVMSSVRGELANARATHHFLHTRSK